MTSLSFASAYLDGNGSTNRAELVNGVLQAAPGNVFGYWGASFDFEIDYGKTYLLNILFEPYAGGDAWFDVWSQISPDSEGYNTSEWKYFATNTTPSEDGQVQVGFGFLFTSPSQWEGSGTFDAGDFDKYKIGEHYFLIETDVDVKITSITIEEYVPPEPFRVVGSVQASPKLGSHSCDSVGAVAFIRDMGDGYFALVQSLGDHTHMRAGRVEGTGQITLGEVEPFWAEFGGEHYDDYDDPDFGTSSPDPLGGGIYDVAGVARIEGTDRFAVWGSNGNNASGKPVVGATFAIDRTELNISRVDTTAAADTDSKWYLENLAGDFDRVNEILASGLGSFVDNSRLWVDVVGFGSSVGNLDFYKIPVFLDVGLGDGWEPFILFTADYGTELSIVRELGGTSRSFGFNAILDGSFLGAGWCTLPDGRLVVVGGNVEGEATDAALQLGVYDPVAHTISDPMFVDQVTDVLGYRGGLWTTAYTSVRSVTAIGGSLVVVAYCQNGRPRYALVNVDTGEVNKGYYRPLEGFQVPYATVPLRRIQVEHMDNGWLLTAITSSYGDYGVYLHTMLSPLEITGQLEATRARIY